MQYDSSEDLVHTNIMKALTIKNCETHELVSLLRVTEKVILEALEDLVSALYVIKLDVYGKIHWCLAPAARRTGGTKAELKMKPPTQKELAELAFSDDSEMEFGAWLEAMDELEATVTMDCNKPIPYEPTKPITKQKRG